VPTFRWLGHLSRLRLTLGYLLGSTVATTLYFVGRGRGSGLLEWTGAALSLLVVSLLFNVVTWYRGEQVVNAALFLAVASTLGYTLAVWVALLFVGPGTGTNVLLMTGSIFGLPIRILISTLVFGALVTVGRRLRRYFAPATLGQEDHGSPRR
jgi:hypothetical protein